MARVGEPYVRFMAEIHPDIKRALIEISEERGVPMKRIVVEALTEYIERVKHPQ